MAARAGTLASVEEYLHTSYHPDCDYIDGHLEERSVGESDHSQVQAALSFFLYGLGMTKKFRVYTGQRVRISPTRYRIPDICVTLGREPVLPILTAPPFLCIEILSLEDRMPRVLRRVDEFVAMRVLHVWIIDPAERAGYTYSKAGLQLSLDNILTTKDPDIRIDLNDCFASIDKT